MDVGYYLGELLVQRGEVKVPGLGTFSQVRMSAYYDESDHLFYPPYNKVQFNPQGSYDDDQLANYLVNKKGISVASARYFIEKYISNLHQQAIIADVALGELGFFCTERGELTFKPNDKLDNSDWFGLAPVSIFKANAIPAPSEPPVIPELTYPLKRQVEPVVSEPAEEEEVQITENSAEENSFQPSYDEAFLELPEEEEEVTRRGPIRAILIAVVILSVIGGGLFALYRYRPATFAKLQFWKNNTDIPPVKATPRPSTIVVPTLDSLHTDSAGKALDTVANVTDNIKTKRFELITDKGYKTLAEARNAVEKLRAAGLSNAKIVEEIPGTLNRISVGTFTSLSESEAVKQKLIKEGKLNEGARTQEIENE